MSGLGDINYDEVYELQVKDSHRHPFHMHLYHMQVVTPGGCGDHVEGEYYDTIAGAKDRPCTVRSRTSDIGQKMVLLEHEDNGSINFMNVVNVPESRMNTVDSPSYACPAVMDDTSATSTEDGASGIGSSSATRWGSIMAILCCLAFVLN